MVQLDYTNFNVNPHLIDFLQNSNLLDIITAEDLQLNEIEQVFFDMLTLMWLDSATGEQLDVLGIHLVIDREGRTDTDYRVVLKGKARINVSSGEPESIIGLVKDLYGASSVEYVPDYPAGFTINHNGILDFFLQGNFIFENGDNFVLENGDNFILQTEDLTAKNLIFGAIPAGVNITINKV